MNWIKNFIINWIKNYLIKNWRTTIISAVGGACSQIPALAPYKEQILAATVVLIGIFAKDGSTTGTAQQPALPAPGTPGVTVGDLGPTNGNG